MWWSFLTADGVTTARLDVGPLDVRCWRTTLFWGLEQIRLDRWLAEMSVYACVCVGWVSVCACRCVCVCVHEGGNKSVWMCMLVRNCEWVTAYMTACVHVGVYMCVGVCVCAIIYGVCVCVREREREMGESIFIFLQRFVKLKCGYRDLHILTITGIWKNLDLVPHSGLIHTTNKQQICVFWS